MRFPESIVHNKTRCIYFYCKSCKHYQLKHKFHMQSSSSTQPRKKCKRCHKDARSNKWSDVDRLLKNIKETEARTFKTNKSLILKCMHKQDIQYLLEKVWKHKTIFSEAPQSDKDKKNLIFTRWDTTKPFVPWNLIYITKKDAKLHFLTENIKYQYSHKIISRVLRKLKKTQYHYQKVSPNTTQIENSEMHSKTKPNYDFTPFREELALQQI